jgi:hypothetical protein
MKLGISVYNNELQIKFEFLRYWSIFDRALGPSYISEVKFAAAGGILVPFKGKHLVFFTFSMSLWDDYSKNVSFDPMTLDVECIFSCEKAHFKWYTDTFKIIYLVTSTSTSFLNYNSVVADPSCITVDSVTVFP